MIKNSNNHNTMYLDIHANDGSITEAPCKNPDPCGVNTKCEVINGVATCSCLPGFRGRPLEGCRHECESDFDCPHHLHCSTAFRCENPCSTKCGSNSECHVVNHRPNCNCPKVTFLLRERRILFFFFFFFSFFSEDASDRFRC